MGIMGFLKFVIICIDFVAWPVIALVYPLLASIRAVETGSVYHMRKLMIYWTLFSLICLFEFSFVKIIEWLPFWSSIKFAAIFWLVMPQFDGACHAYRSLVRPVSVNLQDIVDRFYKLKEEKLRNRETFLDVAEKYIQENGLEALEKFIADKYEHQEHDNSRRVFQALEPEGKDAAATAKHLKEPDASQKDNEMLVATKKSAATEAKQYKRQEPDNTRSNSQVLEPEGKDAAATAKHIKEPDAVQRDNEMLAATKKTAATEEKQVQHARPVTAVWVLKGTDADAAAKVREMTPPESSAKNRRAETPPVKKAQQEWICDLCKVTTTSEKMLNAHLQGSKHKSNCESLKASKLHARDAATSPSATGKSNQGNLEEVKNKVGEGSQAKSFNKTQERIQFQVPRDQQKEAKPKLDGGVNQIYDFYCNICDVKLVSDIDLAAHLRGRRHLSNINI